MNSKKSRVRTSHKKFSRGNMSDPVPKQEVISAVPAKLINDGRKQSHYIIDTLSNTAMTLAASENAGEKVAVIERLWAMQKDAEDRQAEREFGIAKVGLAMELPAIPKNHKIEYVDKNNIKRETPYATREDIEAILDPVCRKHGFSKEYSTETIDGKACQVLTVRHVSGHKEVYRSPYMPLDTTGNKNNNQAAGSTAEYGKRYAVIGAFNIIGADKDDDGTGGDAMPAKNDKFAERVKESNKGQITTDEAAAQLHDVLNKAPSKERRGEILMQNVKILAALEAEGKQSVAEELRKLAEEEVNG